MEWFTEKNDNLGLSLKIKSRKSYNSSLQQIEVLDSIQYGKVLVIDGVIQTSEIDEFIYHEMITHIPMLSHPNPENILVIGGGDGGVVRELSKYSNVKITLVEIDEKVIQVAKEEFPEISASLNNKNVTIINEDGSKFIKRNHHEYDIIIIDSSEPISHSANLFSKEFYCNVKKALKNNGIVTLQSESPLINLELIISIRKLLLSIFKIVEHYFAPMPTYPTGLWSFTYASSKYKPKILKDKKLLLPKLNNKYLNEEIFKASFAMPNFVKEALKCSLKNA